MTGSVLASLAGMVLVVVGVVFVALQMLSSKTRGQAAGRSMSAAAGPIKLRFSTSFPGLLVIGLGVVLLIVGALTGH